MTKKDFAYPEVVAPDYSSEEVEQRGYIIERLKKAKDLRDKEHEEFDDMSYVDYYESNAKAANAYMRSKKNREDLRVVTGTTMEKIDTYVNALLALNLQPNIRAYDVNNREIRELGENMEAMILQSHEQESPDFQTKFPLIVREGVVQGDAYAEDVHQEYELIGKKLTADKWDEAVKGKKVWKEEKDLYSEIQTNLISGLNLYAGNIRDFYIQSQPYMFVRELKTWEECKQIYGKWKRWEYVPARVNKLTTYSVDGVSFNDWSLEETKEGFVEVIKYYDKPNNVFQVFLNGVMMLPVDFPLEALLGVNDYPIRKFSCFPISRHFFYSKGLAAKLKFDQGIMDEFYKMAIIKTQKSYKPSLANNGTTHLTEKIFMPGMITEDINPDDIKEIGENNGVTAAEFNMLQYVKGVIDNKSVDPVFEGQSSEGSQTATESMLLQKQSTKKLGLPIYGLTNFIEEMAWLRLYNLIHFWTKAIDTKVDKVKGALKEVYRRIEMEDDFEDGTKGTRVIQFTEKPRESEQILADEKLLKKRYRKQTRIYEINPKELRNMKIHWEIEVTATPSDSDALDRAQFEESMIKGLQVFQQKMNMGYWAEQWAIKNKLDPEKAFIQEQPQQALPQAAVGGMMPGMQGGGANMQAQQAVKSMGGRRPSINTLVNA